MIGGGVQHRGGGGGQQHSEHCGGGVQQQDLHLRGGGGGQTGWGGLEWKTCSTSIDRFLFCVLFLLLDLRFPML